MITIVMSLRLVAYRSHQVETRFLFLHLTPNYGVRMVPQKFAVQAKLGFCSECSQNFSGYSFDRARIFLQVFACSVFSGGKFLKSTRCSQG